MMREGIPEALALRDTDVSPQDVNSPAARISVAQLLAAYRNALTFSRDPAFAIRLGQSTQVTTLGMYGYALLSTPNQRGLIDLVLKYHRLMLATADLSFREEADAKRRVIEAEAKAREDAIRRAKEEEEAKIRAVEEKARREREEKERKVREERLRVEEAERRARIEAEAKLEEARIGAEARIAAAKKPPVRLIAGIAATVLVVALGSIFYVVQRNEAEKTAARQRAEAEIRRQQEQKAKLEEEQRLAKEEAARQARKLQDDLAKSTNAADRERIQKQIDATNQDRKRGGGGKKPSGGGGNSGAGGGGGSEEPGGLPGM